MKYIILIPIYNDRESLKIQIENINNEINNLNHDISLLVINDASSQQIIDTYLNTENISSIEIINMKENRGHARCIASGLKYIFEKKDFDFVIPMDGDGEDRPEEIKNFIQLSEQSGEKSIIGERVKRSEGLFFQFCYKFHKFLIEKDLISIPSIRGKRYFGPSQMSFFNLLKHSLSIISVFRKTVLIRSALFIIFYILLIKSYASVITSLPLVFLLIMIYSISSLALRENIEEFNNCLTNIHDIDKIK